MNNAILRDNVAIRKAIAWATDYDMINMNAMTGQSPTFQQIPRSMMNPTDGEQNSYNRDDAEVKALQWVGNDIEGAKALLDEAGITDTDGDGWRELNGEKLAFNIACPNGWTDWMASIEIVAAAGKNIGLDISTLFPEADPFQSTVTGSPNQTEYDIFMMWTDSIAPSAPWSRVRQFLDGDLAPLENNWTGNWGRYVNAEATALVKAIPTELDPARLKDLYTQAVKLYLTEVPSFAVMYRPDKFHAVNESVWTGYTEAGDGRNVPPFNCLSGYAIADLYNLSLV
jgi:peptide/nickel transport system substrate-binding protein